MPALYLALTIEGMLVEMGFGFAHRFDPLTICSYTVDVDDLIDLRTEADCEIAGIDWSALSCAWAYDLVNGQEPASWKVAKALFMDGAAGVLVPSFAGGARRHMANLVLWRWGPNPPHQVAVHDPDGRLPRDPSPWMPPPS